MRQKRNIMVVLKKLVTSTQMNTYKLYMISECESSPK
jgi:hypothetical protein